MPLSAAQQEICDSPKRFRCVIAGRRFGKTTISIREICRWARYPKKRVWYVAPSYRQARQTVWNKLKETLLDLNWVVKINESELTIILRNGSEVALRSADNYDSLRGVGLNFIVLDEFASMQPEVWYEVLRPTLSDTGGGALFIGTPQGIGNWSKDIYDMALTDPKHWESFSYTTVDGGNVPPEEIEAARRDLDPRTFRQEYEASFEAYTGVIYYALHKDNITEIEPLKPNETIEVGMDFNRDPMSAVVAVRRGEYLDIIESIEIPGSNTQEMAEELRRKYPGRKINVYPDASGQRKSTSSEASDHAILRNAGFTVLVNRTNPAVVDRISAVNSRLTAASGEHYIRINMQNNRCKGLINCLTRQTYREGTRIPDKDSGLDHLPDALGYMVSYIWPVRTVTNIDPYAPKVFGRY
jgi:hypothetical protein